MKIPTSSMTPEQEETVWATAYNVSALLMVLAKTSKDGFSQPPTVFAEMIDDRARRIADVMTATLKEKLRE